MTNLGQILIAEILFFPFLENEDVVLELRQRLDGVNDYVCFEIAALFHSPFR